MLLDELGLYDNFVTPLRENYLTSICRILYPDLVGDGLDSHKAFTVTYKMTGDHELSTHFDNAEITINICLGKQFEEGSLYFGGMKDDPPNSCLYKEVKNRLGYGVLHRGQQVHGALPIENGERHNLIIWMRSSKVRNKKCPMCCCRPVLVPSEGFGDGFTEYIVNMCDVA